MYVLAEPERQVRKEKNIKREVPVKALEERERE